MPSLASGLSLGTGSVSSLLKSASTIQNEINSFNDTVQANAFDNDHSDEAYQTYNDYLTGRISTLQASDSITDQTKAATLSQTQINALKSNQSFDIQTSTIAALDGTGTDQEKLQTLGDAFQKLYAVGDVNAAQSYESQYYSFSQTVQLKQQQAADALASAATASESAYSSAVTAGIDSIKNNIQNANAAFSTVGPKFLDEATNAYLKNQTDATGAKVNGSASIFAALGGQVGMVQPSIQLNDTTKYAQGTYTPGSELDLYTQAIIGDPTKAATYQGDIDSILNGATGVALPGDGTKSITYSALMNTIYAGNSGTGAYNVVQAGDGSYEIENGHISGYVFGKDQNGNTKLMPSYSLYTSPLPTGKGSVGAELAAAGVNVKNDSNGDSWFQGTKQASFISKVLGTNIPIQGSVQKDGSIEFMSNDGKLLSLVKGGNGKFGFQQINQFGQVVNPNVGGQYGFVPPEGQVNVVKGSTDFMTKVLGDSATPTEVNGKTTYQANGKLYQLTTDTKGLKGLQEIDKTGKVIDSNVAGQYGFNPSSLTRGSSASPAMKGTQFIASLSNQHEQYMNGLTHPDSFKDSDGVNAFSPSWLGVDNLINNAQLIQTVNTAHNQAMLAMASPVDLPKLSLPLAQGPTPLQQAQAPKLNVASSASTSTLQPTANPQPASPKSTQILQPSAGALPSNVQGVPLTQTSGPSIKL